MLAQRFAPSRLQSMAHHIARDEYGLWELRVDMAVQAALVLADGPQRWTTTTTSSVRRQHAVLQPVQERARPRSSARLWRPSMHGERERGACCVRGDGAGESERERPCD